MCQKATSAPGRAGWCRTLAPVVFGALALAGFARAQAPVRPDWRHIGNEGIDLSLASPAGGPVDRVWFSPDGSLAFARTGSGAVFETSDFEKWAPSQAVPPAEASQPALRQTPAGAQKAFGSAARAYAYGSQVYRSDDGGDSWTNLTAYESRSILGGTVADAAMSPRNPDEVVVATGVGVWRSLDGGGSWSGVNELLPNLPVRRILSLPQGSRGVRADAGGFGTLEWMPGEKQAWRVVGDTAAESRESMRRSAAGATGAAITAVAMSGDVAYAGSSDGRLFVSFDRGGKWTRSPAPESGQIEAIYADAAEPRLALAAVGRAAGRSPRVLRTVNGGVFWDDITADLPATAAFGIAADRSAGAVYAATDRGVYFTRLDLNSAGPPAGWTPLAGLPNAPALDVRLDSGGNQLFVAVAGYGVYSAIAPHRTGALRWVNAADFSQRAAAPGSLVSILGGQVDAARSDSGPFPLLPSTGAESQVQVPFEAAGNSLALTVESGGRSLQLGLPLQQVSPAVFVDRDGTPLLLNADTGVLLDALNPARSNSRVQVLATGLGKVTPEWPTGRPGPEENPPRVVAPVRAFLDGAPVEVTRAVLAPGYIGIYLVEVQLPSVVNVGPAELYLESQGRDSNRVRLYLEP